MNQPLISIIIPTFNRAHLLSDTLDSLLQQTYKQWECIVVDDGSTDNTADVMGEYLAKDARFQYYNRPNSKSKGPNSCRNFGFEMSKGNYIHWFDSDDRYLPFALETYIKVIDTHADVVVAKLEIINFVSAVKIKENRITSDNLVEDYFTGKIAYYVCGPLWKRSFLNEQPCLFDETIRNLDDWDFNLRMLYAKPIVKLIDKPLMQYRYHESSLSQELVKLNCNEILSEFAAREKHLQLISQNKMADLSVLKRFVKNRYKYFFREALMQNHSEKMYFLKELLRSQFFLFDIYGIMKTLTGFLIFSLFGKGYALLK
jgi:glycosyltransferase involved in cell wall biosynthesis